MARNKKLEKENTKKTKRVKNYSNFVWKKLPAFIFAGTVIFFSVINLTLWTLNELAEEKRKPIEREIAGWESLLSKTPTYRDGYLKLATLYWRLKDDQRAIKNLEKAEEIDPNHEETKKLKEKLEY